MKTRWAALYFLVGSTLGLALSGCGNAAPPSEAVSETTAAFDAGCAAATPAATFTNKFIYNAFADYPAGCTNYVVLAVNGIDASPSIVPPPGSPARSKIEISWLGAPASTTSDISCFTPSLELSVVEEASPGTWTQVAGAISNPWRPQEICLTPPSFSVTVPAEKPYKILAAARDQGFNHEFRVRRAP
jgi:hypothetical protein